MVSELLSEQLKVLQLSWMELISGCTAHS